MIPSEFSIIFLLIALVMISLWAIGKWNQIMDAKKCRQFQLVRYPLLFADRYPGDTETKKHYDTACDLWARSGNKHITIDDIHYFEYDGSVGKSGVDMNYLTWRTEVLDTFTEIVTKFKAKKIQVHQDQPVNNVNLN